MTNFHYFKNTGGINKFADVTTLNSSETNTDWHDAQNVEDHKSGGITKMKGNINICTTSLPANTLILGIGDYVKGSDNYPMVNTSEGKLYRLDLTTGVLTQKFTGLNASAKCCYANYNNGVIMTNGVNTPVFYEEGVGASALTGSPPTGRPIEIYKSRVFIASGSTLYYSALGNQNNWTAANDAGYISNFYNDSSPIMALKIYGEFLAIYKQYGTYILSGSSPTDFVIKPILNKGAVSPWTVGTVDNRQYFFNGTSIAPLQFNDLGQVRAADEISTKIKNVFSDLNSAKYSETVCIPYPQKNQIWFYFASKNSTTLDICYVYDYFHRSWNKRVALPITCGAIINGIIYTGTSNGKILKEDCGNNFNGAAIEAWWLSPWFTFGNPEAPKEVLSFYVWLYKDQMYSIDVLSCQDYNPFDENVDSITTIQDIDLVWDVSNWDVGYWSGNNVIKKKIAINGQFESLQVGVRNLQADQPFTLVGYSFDVDMGEA